MVRFLHRLAPTRRYLLWIGLGLVLRFLLIWYTRPGDPDTQDYLELGHNLIHHGIYGEGSGSDIAPTLFRLPGYPIVLGIFEGLFARFWPNGWLNVLFIAQALIDLLGGFLLASFARRHLSPRAAEAALALAMLCPFTAVETGLAMTECLSIFAVSLGIYAAGRAFAAQAAGVRDTRALILAGVAAALAMLLRPDGAVLFATLAAGLIFYSLRIAAPKSIPANSAPARHSLRSSLAATSIFAVVALLPLVPWTIRNWEQFHVIQPLAPQYFNDPGQRVNLGFYSWLRTWTIEYVDTATVAWNAGEDYIDPSDIPPRAWDSPQQRARTLALIAEYNQVRTISAGLDDQFGALAAERKHAHPLSFYLVLPFLRDADMLLRPRTEAFYLEVFWWQYSQHPAQTDWAILLGLINLFYVAAAAWAFLRRRVPFAWMLGGYLMLRFLLLGVMFNPEPRYTLECFPIFIVAAAAALTRAREPASTAPREAAPVS